MSVICFFVVAVVVFFFTYGIYFEITDIFSLLRLHVMTCRDMTSFMSLS